MGSTSAGNRFSNPSQRRRRPPVIAVAAEASTIGLLGIEVVQSVQDIDNSVVLLAGKTTVVRVYLDHASFTRAGAVSGEIAWSRGGGETYLPATATIRLDPAKPVALLDQRHDLATSLNFVLPREAVGEGPLKLRLSRLWQPGGADVAFGGPAPVEISFRPAPVLRVRAIGLRYAAGDRMVTPAAVHFAHFRSFLQRAYPVADVEWSQIVVDADFSAPFMGFTVDLANAQVAALRSREVSSGMDPRTHYYGLVDDDGGRNFLRGKAFAIPGTPQPDVVASGPAGVPNGFFGDRDASYADWYGAHELGHTFGRFHPGFPLGEQDASDPHFPYENGCISDPGGRFVGLDVGDPALGVAMAVLPGHQCHDVMTYAENQWMSPYTYQAILDRLSAEQQI